MGTSASNQSDGTLRDLAVSLPSEDELGRNAFVENVTRSLLTANQQSTGITLAIEGDWGSGKTSVLNLIQDKLRTTAPTAIVLRFEPWLTAGQHSLVASFLKELRATIEKERDKDDSTNEQAQIWDKLQKIVDEYGAVITKEVASFYVASDSEYGAFVALSLKLSTLPFFKKKTKPRKASLVDLRDQLKEQLQLLNRAIIVIIDDIDRLPDEDIRAMAQLVKAVAYFESISFVLAYDSRRVAEALGETNIERGRAYLKKIVQFGIPLPYLHPEQCRFLLSERLRSASSQLFLPNDWQSDEDYDSLVSIVVPLLIRTPRDILRVVNSFIVRHRMIGREVYWVDSLGFSVLELECPGLAQNIHSLPWHVASDAKEMPLYDNQRSMWNLLEGDTAEGLGRREIIGEIKISPAVRALLNFLFPKLADPDDRPDRSNHPDRINRYRALLTLIGLGLPSGAISFDEIQSTAQNGNSQLSYISDTIRNGSFLQFVDRFAETQSRISYDEGLGLWRSIALALDEPFRSPRSDPEFLYLLLASRVSRIWHQAVERDTRFKGAMTGLLGQLMVDGGTELLSVILYDYAHEHNLFDIASEDSDEPVPVSKDTTESYCRQVGERLAEEFLRREKWVGLRGHHPLLIVSMTNSWKEKHRLVLTDLLQDAAVLDGFVAVIFGKENSTDMNFIAKFVSVDIFVKHVKERQMSALWSNEQKVVAAAYKKAHSRLGLRTLYQSPP